MPTRCGGQILIELLRLAHEAVRKPILGVGPFALALDNPSVAAIIGAKGPSMTGL
jgi:hypothetical protein